LVQSFLLTFILIAAMPATALAQGFQVRPMQMDYTIPAAKISETELVLSNTTTEDLALDVRVVELTQASNGSWQIVSNDGPVSEFSARPWISLQTESVIIEPASSAAIGVRFSAPPSARGTYVAGIVAEQPTPEGATGLIVRVRFLIPVIIQIEDRPVRQEVELDDVQMVFDAGEQTTARTTTAHVEISNRGRTYSRVQGEIRIDRRSGENWRSVTRIEVPERGIIPGVSLSLGGDLKRSLPSGEYRLRGEVYVDGRRIRPLEKVIDFQGDPNIDAVAYDTTLILQPAMVEMAIAPGAVRSTSVRVENPGDSPVTVRATAEIPNHLRSAAMGELIGSSLSAAAWTAIRPSEFAIRPGGRQNIRVTSQVPKEGVDHANYYAELILQGTYADGQSGGETRSKVHLVNKNVEATPDGVIERLTIAEGSNPSEFLVHTRFINTGNIHLEPRTRAEVVTSDGDLKTATNLTGEAGALLPLEQREYGGSLDLSRLEPGDYLLRVVSDFAETDSIRKQLALRVTLAEAATGEAEDAAAGVRMVEVLETEDHQAQSLGSIESTGAKAETGAGEATTTESE
jgi:hypothetical protein